MKIVRNATGADRAGLTIATRNDNLHTLSGPPLQRTLESHGTRAQAHFFCCVMITTAVTITAAAAAIGHVTTSPATAQPSNTAITGLT